LNKIIPFVIVGILVFSGLGAATTSLINRTNNNTEKITENYYLEISNPTFTQEGEFVTIELEQAEAFMPHSGKPMLPIFTKTFAYPVGTRIDAVNVDINWERYNLDKKVTPTPVAIPLSIDVYPIDLEERSFDEEVYTSTSLYPAEPYIIKYGAGIKDMEHVIFVNVKCFPQYSPGNDYVNIPKIINIDVEYQSPETQVKNEEQYDLLIITHEIFEDELQSLVDHKESLGIATKLVTVDEIYDEYDSQSPYDWEQIKMYLADHVLDWDIKFVLLAGGRKGQTYDWWVPDFESNNWEPGTEYGSWDETYSCDLYYSDVYRVNQYGQYEMDNWDSNGNGIYAEGPLLPSGTDQMDFYPDVYLGRFPIRAEWEADVVVDKVINYELNADDSWFKKAVLAGGDGFPPERYPGVAQPGIYEGEIVCDIYAQHLAQRGVVSTKVYCSGAGDIKCNKAEDVYNEISKGCGFVHLTGHSSPWSLGSYEPDTGISPEPPLTAFYNGFDARLFDCGYKLPFMINEGCHNAQFDVTAQEIIDYLLDAYFLHPDIGFQFYHYEWIPHEVSSWFVVQKGGGAIGVIGNTALGSGFINDGITRGLGGWLCLRYAEAWGVDEVDHTGEVYVTGISAYIDTFDVSGWDADRIRIEEQVLLGDPSVRLGGYGSTFQSDNTEETEQEYGQVSMSAPTWSVGDSWTYALENIDIDLYPTEERGMTLELSAGDIILEVIDETSHAYRTSLTSDNIDITFGGVFDFNVEDVDDINIPTIHFDNIQIDAQLLIDKDNLGIQEVNLGLIIEIMENLDNFEDILGFEFPPIVDTLAQYIEIPANINIDIEFDQPIDILQFPLENDNYWGIPANHVAITIGGSVESVWLRILDIINKIIPIIPAEIAQYLPDIDISEILEDNGIATYYEFDTPEIPAALLAYHLDTTALLQVDGSENINTQAGSFNAAKISIVKDNGKIYYAESEGTIVKIIGHISDYIPIIEDINLELIG
jgi:hypothetical protein